MTESNPRPSILAGRWYPADPNQLRESVDRYLADAQVPEIQGQILGLISPHAGHIYSGPVAGYSFAAVINTAPDLAVILAPLHQPYSGKLLTTSHTAYQTPLGSIPVDTQCLEELQTVLHENHSLELASISNDQEHSIEILLPFLQRSLQPGFKILPVMIRDQRPETMQALSAALINLLGEKNFLLIASTDLSHFHPAEEAELLDRTIIDGITALDPASMYRAEAEGRGSACGLGGLAAVIWTARELGVNRGIHLKYAHSGHTSGDFNRVVGYEAAALVQE